jgi:hypothetical protein
MRIVAGSTSTDFAATALTTDHSSADDSAGTPDLDDAFSDAFVIDADDDGSRRGTEAETTNTDPLDRDTDDDGITTATERVLGTDPDPLRHRRRRSLRRSRARRRHAQGHRLRRRLLHGRTRSRRRRRPARATPTAAECRRRRGLNHDGAVGTWETDPNDPTDDVDNDGDGIPMRSRMRASSRRAIRSTRTRTGSPISSRRSPG